MLFGLRNALHRIRRVFLQNSVNYVCQFFSEAISILGFPLNQKRHEPSHPADMNPVLIPDVASREGKGTARPW